MSKLFAATLVLVVLALDPSNAQLHADDKAQQLRAIDGGRMLQAEASTSTDGTLSNPLYESNTKIKGCHWYDYFTPWSCCGTNQCKNKD